MKERITHSCVDISSPLLRRCMGTCTMPRIANEITMHVQFRLQFPCRLQRWSLIIFRECISTDQSVKLHGVQPFSEHAVLQQEEPTFAESYHVLMRNLW